MKIFILITLLSITLASGVISGIAYERYFHREECLKATFDNSGIENLADEEINKILKTLNEKSDTEEPEQKSNDSNTTNDSTDSNIPKQNKTFVGSKNSNKFYSADCRYVKLIKEENKIYFDSIENGKTTGKIYVECK